jgi:hypothetical protein
MADHSRWKEPQDNWIPLGIATFRFGIADSNEVPPRPNPFSVEAFKQSVNGDGGLRCTYEPDTPTVEDLTEILRKHAKAVKAEIDREEGRFLFLFTPPGGGAACHGGTPWAILREPSDSVNARVEELLAISELAKDCEAPYEGFAKLSDDESVGGETIGVRLATGLVWRQLMLSAFDRAVRAGQATLYARIPSLLHDFQRLPSSVWPLLEVVDWDAGVARDMDGTLYSDIHAVSRAAPSAQQKAVITNESAAAKALASRLSSNSEMTREAALSFLTSSGHSVSKRGFLSRIWPRARELAELPPQAPRGRKSKHRN